MLEETASNQFLDIIGIGIHPETVEPDFYALVVEDDSATTRPIMHESYIVLFATVNLSEDVLELTDLKQKSVGPVPKEASLLIDVTQVLYLIESENVDTASTLLHFINVAIDFVKATEYSIPSRDYKLLCDFANYLTFDKNFEFYFQFNKVERVQVRNALVWLIGAIVANVKVVDHDYLEKLKLERTSCLRDEENELKPIMYY